MVHSLPFFAFAIGQAVQAQQVAILGLNDMLLSFVAKKTT